MEVKEKYVFWNKEAKRALAVAEDLFRLKRYVEALFFGHLSLEKLFKAKIIKVTKNDPVYSHDLVILAKPAGFTLDKDDISFLARVNIYNIRARYQDYKRSLSKRADKKFTGEELSRIKKFFRRINDKTKYKTNSQEI